MATIAIDNHILLRNYESYDAPQLFDTINRSRAHLSPWFTWVSKTTKPEHSLEFIERCQMQVREQEALAVGIFYDGVIIGGIGMYNWSIDTRRAQVGYWISKEFEGRGIVTRALASFINYLFNNVGLNKIEIHYLPGNIRSANVAARLGFKIEGCIRQSIISNGRADDVIMAGLLKNEWKMPD